MSNEPITLAFAGTGDISYQNVKALLNDWLGFGEEDKDGFFEPLSDREVTIVFPLTKALLSDGVDAVIEWTEHADLPYIAVTNREKNRAVDKLLKDAEDVHVVANPTAKVVEILQKAEGEKHLILLWGDEGSEEAELLLDAAEAAGIKAKDLTAGLDDISFAADSRTEPEPEPEEDPEPEPEKDPEPKRGRRRSRRAEPEAAEPEEEPLTEEEPEEKPEPVAPARRSRKAKPEPTPEPTEEAEGEGLEQEINREAHKAQQEAPVLDDLANRFAYHPATETTGALHTRVRGLALIFAQALDEILPAGREKATTLAKVEEAMFWANAAIARSGGAPAAAEKPVTEALKAEEPEEAKEDAPATRRRRGRPRDESKTVAFLEDAEGNLTRRGRGRIPVGSKVVQLTRAEIEEKGLDDDSE